MIVLMCLRGCLKLSGYEILQRRLWQDCEVFRFVVLVEFCSVATRFSSSMALGYTSVPGPQRGTARRALLLYRSYITSTGRGSFLIWWSCFVLFLPHTYLSRIS